VPFYLLFYAIVLVIWFVILVAGFLLSGASIVLGVVYYVRHTSTGALARTHLAVTIVLAVAGLILLALAITGAVVFGSSLA